MASSLKVSGFINIKLQSILVYILNIGRELYPTGIIPQYELKYENVSEENCLSCRDSALRKSIVCGITPAKLIIIHIQTVVLFNILVLYLVFLDFFDISCLLLYLLR